MFFKEQLFSHRNVADTRGSCLSTKDTETGTKQIIISVTD